MSRIFEEIQDATIDGEAEEVEELVQEALEEGLTPQDIISEGLVEGMNTVDELFQDKELFIPDVMRAAQAMEAGMNILKPHLEEDGQEQMGKILFCTVKGDLHDVGKKMCIMLLRSAGFEVKDMGVDIGVEEIIEEVRDYRPDILAMSTMLSTTMGAMEDTMAALQENDLDSRVKVMVGGAPVSGDYAEAIGAMYSDDALEAVSLAGSLTEG